MSDLLIGWNKLDMDHKKFVLRVRDGSGGKYAAEPLHTTPNEECCESIALWKKAEESGFIKCTGSYKWVTTDSYARLEAELFGI